MPSGPALPVMLRPRDCDQLEEVEPRPFDSSSVPSDDSRRDPLSGSSCHTLGGGHVISPTPSSSSSHVAVPTRPHVIAGTFFSGGLHSHETPPVSDERPLVASGGQSSLPNPPVSGLCTGNQVVAQRGQMDERGPPSHSAPIPVVINQRVLVGVGELIFWTSQHQECGPRRTSTSWRCGP